jgi:hypothetical protein
MGRQGPFPRPSRTTAHRLLRADSGYLLTGRTIRPSRGLVEVSGGTLSLAAAHPFGVWLTFGLRSVGHRDEAWLKRGLPSSK